MGVTLLCKEDIFLKGRSKQFSMYKIKHQI